MPNGKPTEVLKAVALKYKTATDAQKQEIDKLVQSDRQRFEEQLKVYRALKPKRPLNKYAAFVKVRCSSLIKFVCLWRGAIFFSHPYFFARLCDQSQWPIVKSANPGKSFTEMSALIKKAYSKAL